MPHEVTLIEARMVVEKYHPGEMYGFARTPGWPQVFFHLERFRMGDFEHTPPPIVGEEVVVNFDPSSGLDGKAPRALTVTRVNPPVYLQGTVESFDLDKGWGFVTSPEGEACYLHRSEVQDARIPLPGKRVLYYRGFRQGRPRACYVQVT